LKGGDKMKKKWQAPHLEELDVNLTMANTEQGDYIDKTYPENTRYGDLTWGMDS
jgi:hypothetical protein